METIALRCNHCGAPLDVGANTRFVVCRFCKHSLEVKRSESTIFTEEVERIADATEKMADDLEILRLESELERLERERDAAALGAVANADTRPAAGAFGVAFSLFFAVVAFGMAGMVASWQFPGVFVIVPIGMGVFGIALAIRAMTAANSARGANDTYQRLRAELIAKIETRRSCVFASADAESATRRTTD